MAGLPTLTHIASERVSGFETRPLLAGAIPARPLKWRADMDELKCDVCGKARRSVKRLGLVTQAAFPPTATQVCGSCWRAAPVLKLRAVTKYEVETIAGKDKP